MYFDDNYSDCFVPTTKEYDEILQDYLIYEEYIQDSGADADDLIDGAGNCIGLIGYIKEHGYPSGGYSAFKHSYSWDFLTDKIDNDRALLVGTSSTHPVYRTHWIIAHGYLQGYDGIPYIIVNDGFGSNNIHVTASGQYYPWGFVYINNN